MGSIQECRLEGFICRLCSLLDRNVIHIYTEEGKTIIHYYCYSLMYFMYLIVFLYFNRTQKEAGTKDKCLSKNKRELLMFNVLVLFTSLMLSSLLNLAFSSPGLIHCLKQFVFPAI